MDGVRGNPDDLLKKINDEMIGENRGHLKIFFGYAAGVGKTYAMLEAAHEAKARGVDVVAGYIEPHARPQTAALIDGLEKLEFKDITHKGITVHEFDLDGALKRNPQLILVDELAHTNNRECRHAKRYQDVEELLKAGIDVYTTVNVQHIESLNDIVASITKILVRERIPDKVFDQADQVELMDIEPEDLMERLKEGKVYKETQAQKALQNFFTPENLTALREIALRRCADRVNKISEKARQIQGGEYHTDEHVLVCLSASPSNAKIIRTTARMASAFKGRFTALIVETPELASMSESGKKQLRANISLAQQLGASIETVYGDDELFQITEFARLSGVSKIVVGRSHTGKKGLFRKQPFAERLTNAAPNLDIYIIPDKEDTRYKNARAKQQGIKISGKDILKSLTILILTTGIGIAFSEFGFSESNIIAIYILGVLVTAIITGHRMCSLAFSVISVLTFNFFFTSPKFTFQAYDSGYPVTFFIMFVSAFLTGTLAVRLKQHAQRSAQIAYRTKILLDTNQMLQKEEEKENVIMITLEQLVKLLRKDIVFYPADNQILGRPFVSSASGLPVSEDIISENEQAVAAWVFQNNKHAGATTNTLGSAKCLYLAARVNEAVYGVVGISMDGEPLDSFENNILLSIVGECALALENLMAFEEREEAAVIAKNEQLRANLLRSISHDLRTPLTSISGNAGILLASEDAIDKEKRRVLYSDIYDDSLWLINLVENLLSVTRIEDGSMSLKLTAELMEEVVSEALRHISRKSEDHKIISEEPEEFIIAKMDARLIAQVIINLVDNAIKYTPKGSEIIVRTIKKDGFAEVSVEDNGIGITDEAKPQIFDMFYTAEEGHTDNRRSLGMGLALCKAIITAHGGEISVRDNWPKGAIFTFTLPLEEVTLHE